MTKVEQGKLPPTVLILSSNAPSGGAGTTADIQAVTALAAHPAPVITALTVQNSRDAEMALPVATDFVATRLRCGYRPGQGRGVPHRFCHLPEVRY